MDKCLGLTKDQQPFSVKVSQVINTLFVQAIHSLLQLLNSAAVASKTAIDNM